MRHKQSFLVILAAVFVAASSIVAGAQGHARPIARMKQLLALTDAQVSEIGALQKKHVENAQPLKRELRIKTRALRAALDAAEPNTNNIGQLVIARRAVRNQLRKLNLKFRTDIAAVLTPEQKEKFGQLTLRRRARKG